MLLASLAVVIGLIILVWSSDKFIDGAAAIAQNFGVSKLMVGLTIVGVGTSAPEILVSSIASYEGATGLAVGNAIGSNIANIGLILGITAIFYVMPVHPLIVKQDLSIYLFVVFVTGFLLSNSYLGLYDSLVLLFILAIIIASLIRFRSKVDDDIIKKTLEGDDEEQMSNKKAILIFLVGLLLLLASSRMLVWGAVEIAGRLGVDDLIIGLTVVAIGTSLPELAATFVSAMKKHHDMAIGNVVGSNVLNLLVVLSMPGLIRPGVIPNEVFNRDFIAMLLLSILMAAFIAFPRGKAQLGRIKGLMLVGVYCGYTAFLVMGAVRV